MDLSQQTFGQPYAKIEYISTWSIVSPCKSGGTIDRIIGFTQHRTDRNANSLTHLEPITPDKNFWRFGVDTSHPPYGE